MYFPKTPALAKHLFKEVAWSIPAKGKKIYLSFDDGPAPEITEWTLDVLKKYNAKATFFCIGKNIEAHPGIFQKILAGNHSIGNHTYDHLNGWKTSAEKYSENVKKCEEAIGKYSSAGKKETSLFRPPYGKILRSQISALKSRYSIIMWDVLSGDFDQSLSGEKCLNNVIKNARNGSIVVFHDSEKASRNLFYALPKVLEYFEERRYGFGQL